MPELPYAQYVSTTPLHRQIAQESKTNQWVEWNGFTTPSVLTSLGDEERAFRTRAVICDISPLFKYRIAGKNAHRYLEKLVTRSVVTLSVGEVTPVLFCEERGLVVGEGLLSKFNDYEYRLTTDESHFAWLLDSAADFDVDIQDVTANLAGIGLKGPFAERILKACGINADVPMFGVRRSMVLKSGVDVVRLPESGISGYELWIDGNDAPPLWALLMEKGGPFGLVAAGMNLRELVRLENGMPMAGRDYLGAFSVTRLEDASTPLDLGLMPLADRQGRFTGHDAIRRIEGSKPNHTLLRVQIDWPEPLAFSALHKGADRVGVITSCAFSTTFGLSFALARVKSDNFQADMLRAVAETRRAFNLEQVSAPVRLGLLGFD